MNDRNIDDLNDLLFNSISIGLFRTNKDGRLLGANLPLARMLDCSSVDELLNHKADFVEIFDILSNYSEIPPLNESTNICKIERHFYNKDGVEIILNLNVWSTRDIQGNLLGFEGFMEDVTHIKRAGQKNIRRDSVMEAISIAAEEFLQTPDAEASISKALDLLGHATGASRVYVFHNSWMEDDLIMNLLYEWNESVAPPLLSNSQLCGLSYQKGGFYRWMEMLSQNKCVVGNIDNFPESEKFILEQEEIKSILIAPILVELDWWGFVGFDVIARTKIWEQKEIEAVRIAASILGAAFQRQKMEDIIQKSNERFRTVADFTHDWEYWISPEGKFLYSSPSFKEITGYNFEYVQQDISVFDRITHPDDCERVLKYIKSMFVFPDVGTLEYRIITKDGHERWISHVSKPVYDQNGKYLGQRASNRDVTMQKRAEEGLYMANVSLNKYVEKLEHVNHLLILLNEMGGILQRCLSVKDVYMVVGEYLERLFPQQNGAIYVLSEETGQYEAITIIGDSSLVEKKIINDDCWALRRKQPHFVESSKTKLKCQHIVSDDNVALDDFRPYLCIPLLAQDQILGLLHLTGIPGQENHDWKQIAITVAERTALAVADLNLRETLRLQSIIDPLTNLFNRRFMTEMLERETRRANRQKSPLAVVIIDIDDFKIYNDQYGHDAGDAIIRSLSYFLKNNTRTEDIACRYGGDEFVLIMPGTALERAEKRIFQIFEKIKDLKVIHKDRELKQITVSMGVSCYPEHGNTEEELLRAADTALYKAKEEGRNCIMVADILKPALVDGVKTENHE